MVFITNGAVGVGYRLFNEIFYGMSIIMSKTKKIISPINDYSCLSNKSSEFLYKPIEYVEALAMRKYNFNCLMQDPVAKRIKQEIAKTYKYVIQEPLHEHRDEMASKFENRIDYVDISAYGIGKVKVEGNGQDEKEKELEKIEQDSIQHNSTPVSRIYYKILNFDKSLKNIQYSLASMATRQEDRFQMVFGQKAPDEFQRQLMERLFQTDAEDEEFTIKESIK